MIKQIAYRKSYNKRKKGLMVKTKSYMELYPNLVDEIMSKLLKEEDKGNINTYKGNKTKEVYNL